MLEQEFFSTNSIFIYLYFNILCSLFSFLKIPMEKAYWDHPNKKDESHYDLQRHYIRRIWSVGCSGESKIAGKFRAESGERSCQILANIQWVIQHYHHRINFFMVDIDKK